MRAVCASHGLIGDASDECCQQVWVQLAAAMQNFRYDPGLWFRGWLHLFFHRRISDTLRRPDPILPTGSSPEMSPSIPPRRGMTVIRATEKIVAMLRRAAQVQDAVQARVTPENWEVFRLVGIEGWPVAEAAGFSGDNIPQCTGRTNE